MSSEKTRNQKPIYATGIKHIGYISSGAYDLKLNELT